MDETESVSAEDRNFVAPVTGFKKTEPVGKTEQETPEQIRERWERIDNQSPANLERIFSQLEISDEQRQQIAGERDRIASISNVSIRMPTRGLAGFLKNGQFKTNLEATPLLTRFVEKWFGEERLQRRAERKMGISPKGGKDDPPIVYGAVHVPDLRDSTGIFGKHTVILNEESVKERATFTYGDSFFDLREGATAADFPLTWEDALTARATMNVLEENYSNYTEAQIMGGVKVEDVKRIIISRDDRYEVDKKIDLLSDFRSDARRTPDEIAEKIRRSFPWIEVEFAEDKERK